MTTLRRRSSTRGPARRVRRRGFWVDTIVSQNPIANNTVDLEDLLATPSQFDKFGLTLVHTILGLTVYANIPSVATGVQAVDLSIFLIEQDAEAASARPDTSFPDDQPGRGWIYKERFLLQNHTTPALVWPGVRVERRLRGKRKIDDMELMFRSGNFNVRGTPFDVNVDGFVRQYFLR